MLAVLLLEAPNAFGLIPSPHQYPLYYKTTFGDGADRTTRARSVSTSTTTYSMYDDGDIGKGGGSYTGGRGSGGRGGLVCFGRDATTVGILSL